MNKFILIALLLLGTFAIPTSATYTPTAIRSIQQGGISIAIGQLTNTATISAVTVANTAVAANIYSIASASGIAVKGDFCRLELTNSTTLTATREALAGAGTADSGCSLYYTVFEFVGNFVKSRNTGATNAVFTTTASLSPAVVVAKSACFYAGHSEAITNNYPGGAFGSCTVASTTTVSLNMGVAEQGTMAWTVLEFR